jgi:hypothetical protein
VFQWEVNGDSREFCVLVKRSNPIPTTRLDQSVSAIYVETLLSVPTIRARSGLMSFRR